MAMTRGFTLIELLVVIGIAGVILTYTFRAMGGLSQPSERLSQGYQWLQGWDAALMRLRLDMDGRYPRDFPETQQVSGVLLGNELHWFHSRGLRVGWRCMDGDLQRFSSSNLSNAGTDWLTLVSGSGCCITSTAEGIVMSMESESYTLNWVR